MVLINGEEGVSRRELEAELGKIEARLQGILEELQSQNRVIRLGLSALASRVKRLEEQSLTEERLYAALEKYFNMKKRFAEHIASWAVPAGVISLLVLLIEFLRG